MKISVIIPVFNEETVIRECLQSLFEQSVEPQEIIIVDDGSTDSTIEKIQELQKTNKNVWILSQKHQGPGLARNFGAKNATGEILVFVDADVTFDSSFIKKLTRKKRQKKPSLRISPRGS